MRNLRVLPFALAIAVSSFIFALCPAEATVLAYGVREQFNTSVSSPGGSVVTIPLTNSGNTSLTFTTSVSQVVVVTYTAECSGVSPAGSAMMVNFFIDGIAMEGTGYFTSARMCFSGDSIQTVSRTAVLVVAPGNHTLQIKAWISPSGGSGGFNRAVTTVMN
jgi:hypothetical protein